MDRRKYWFGERRFGLGWGPPVTWQGRVVVGAYILVVVGPLLIVDENSLEQSRIYLGTVVLATLALLVICMKHGAPPGARWGRGRSGR